MVLIAVLGHDTIVPVSLLSLSRPVDSFFTFCWLINTILLARIVGLQGYVPAGSGGGSVRRRWSFLDEGEV